MGIHIDLCIKEKLNSLGIGAQSYFPPIHLQPPYVKLFNYKKGDFPVCEKVSDTAVAIPFYTFMTDEDILAVKDTLKSIL